MKKYKILSVHWGLIPGGVAKYAASLTKLDNSPVIEQFSILIQHKHWPKDQEASEILKPTEIKIKNRWDLNWFFELRKELITIKPDAIFIFGFNGCFASFFASSRLSIPIYGSWHGDYFASNMMQKIRKPFIDIIERIMYRYVVRKIIAVSEFSARRLIDKGVPSSKISVIHNGIPFKRVKKSVPEKKDIGLLVGTCCRLSEQKGLIWLLDVIKIVKSQNTKINFVIWGDGPQRALLESKSKELRISDVLSFAGHVHDVGPCYRAMDIFVMTSYAEYFSIALLEAMRAGLPIVATDVGGNPEAIRSGIDGFLVGTNEPKRFAQAVLELANSSSLRNNMAQSARKRFEEMFTDDVMIRKTVEWFENKLARTA